MSRITHFKLQPVNVQFWDYYILCHLNAEAAICLQRMEYWDGTKEDGNTHAEDINGTLEQAGKQPTQDTSNWIYKAQDALTWELMGIVGERRMPQVVNFLVDDLKYIARRNNPHNTWDRKKQYAFNAATVQEHINYLGYIISYFGLPMRRLCPVFYAIETLTREGKFIDKLNVKMVLEKLEEWKENAEKLPHFLKEEIAKFFSSLSKSTVRPFRNFAEWKAQKRGMHSAKTQNRKRKIAESIPQKRGSNSIEDYHRGQPIEDKHNEGTEENAHVSDDNAPTPSLSESNSSSSLQETSIEESTPAPSVSDSQNAKQNGTDPKVKQANTAKASSRAPKPVTAKPTRPEIAVEFANEDERAMWERLGYDEQVFYAQWDTQARRNYADWCSLFTSRPTISQKMFDAAKKWTPTVNAAQKMEQIKDWCFTIDKKTANYPKGYYNTYGVNLWDVVEKSPTWELLQERQEKQKANSPSSGQKSALAQESGITRPELYRPAEDNNPLREASLNRQWIDPKKRNRRVFGNEAS